MPNDITAKTINTIIFGIPVETANFSDILLMQLKIIIITFLTALKASIKSDLTRSDLIAVNKVANTP